MNGIIGTITWQACETCIHEERAHCPGEGKLRLDFELPAVVCDYHTTDDDLNARMLDQQIAAALEER